jgi:hypothetical protein
MADKTMGGPAKGQSHGGDQTALPGQAAGKLPFGISNPLNTGAPGTGGTGPASDPTLQAPVPASSFGASNDDTDTGAPGSSGTTAGVAAGATYTKDMYGAYPMDSATGGSVDTEAQSNKYGSDTRIPGLHTPSGTGAPASGGHASVTDGSQRIH